MTLPAQRALVLLLALACPALAAAQQAPPEPKRSVILFIGDGMGPAQVTLGRLAAAELKRPYHLDRFHSVGLASTRSADYPVTDSAAAATALASGVKTNNQCVGIDPSGAPRETILEVAHRSGYATGLVTTTRITHATPAAFAAHVNARSKEAEIAEQLATQPYPDVLVGGGLRNFPDGRVRAMRAAGWDVVTTLEGLRETRGRRVAALLSKSHLPYALDGGPSLRDLTQRAVELLKASGRPFFLMVEGGRIDHAAHQHDAAAMIPEQLAFDEAVGLGLDLARRDSDLLVVVTADHATGSLGVSERADLAGLLRAKGTTEALAPNRVKHEDPAALAAFAEKVQATFGFAPTDAELARVFQHPKDYYWGATALGHIASARFGIYWYDLDVQQELLTNTHGHDGAMVPVYAFGPDAAHFQGTYENTEIPRRIAHILGLPAVGRPLATPAPANGGSGWY